jgi:cytochrome c5
MGYNRGRFQPEDWTLRDQDAQFFDSFMLVLGILVGAAVGLFFLARIIAIDTQGQFVLEDPRVQQEINARIRPIGEVMLLGSEELESLAAAPAPQAQQVETTLSGPQVYNQACYLCHSPPGVGGAPALGDPAAWESRIDKGIETLNNSAINGFQGDAGFMPAKGGRMDLSDSEIISAVEYMLEQAEGGGGGAGAEAEPGNQ